MILIFCARLYHTVFLSDCIILLPSSILSPITFSYTVMKTKRT
jgi:hypothetical protein